MPSTRPHIDVRINPAAKASLEALAKRANRSLANYVETVLVEHVQANGGKGKS